MSKVRIVSDGTPRGIKVFLEDGTMLKGITHIEFNATPSAVVAHISIVCINPELQIAADALISKVGK